MDFFTVITSHLDPSTLATLTNAKVTAVGRRTQAQRSCELGLNKSQLREFLTCFIFSRCIIQRLWPKIPPLLQTAQKLKPVGKRKKWKRRISFRNWRPQLDSDDAPTQYQNHIRQQLQTTSRASADTLEQILLQAAQNTDGAIIKRYVFIHPCD